MVDGVLGATAIEPTLTPVAGRPALIPVHVAAEHLPERSSAAIARIAGASRNRRRTELGIASVGQSIISGSFLSFQLNNESGPLVNISVRQTTKYDRLPHLN